MLNKDSISGQGMEQPPKPPTREWLPQNPNLRPQEASKEVSPQDLQTSNPANPDTPKQLPSTTNYTVTSVFLPGEEGYQEMLKMLQEEQGQQ